MKKSKKWFLETDEIYTSELTLFQLTIILSKITGRNEEKVFKDLSRFFYDIGVRFIHLENGDLPKVSEISEKYKLDFEDTIHYYLSTKVN